MRHAVVRTPLHVLVVDDHEIVRLGVRHLLGERALLSEAATLREARAMLAAAPFDLLLLDLGLGDDFGLTALADLRGACPAMKVIVLTSMAEDLYAERALRAGADGFVMKSALGAQLLAAIDAVLAGQVWVSAQVGSVLLRRMAGQDGRAGADTRPGALAPGPREAPAGRDARPALSAREIEVLRLVGAGKSTREIAEVLNRSVKTIETHKQSLKTKLGADNPAMLMRLALAWSADAP